MRIGKKNVLDSQLNFFQFEHFFYIGVVAPHFCAGMYLWIFVYKESTREYSVNVLAYRAKRGRVPKYGFW